MAYPTTEVDIHIRGVSRKARVVVAHRLPVSVLLGHDVHDMHKGLKPEEVALLVQI